MATHYICHSTEPMPHSYPCTGAGQKTHGAVSQYEILNMAPKTHTQFPPPDWSWSQTSEDDSLPLRQPVPISKLKQAAPGPDPDLCVTPIKIPSGVNKQLLQPDPDLCLTFDNLDLSSLPETEVNPKQNDVSSVNPDPDLSLTPELFAKTKSRSTLRQGNVCEANVMKGKYRVRFDLHSIDDSEGDFSSNVMSDIDSCVNSKSNSGVTVCKHYEPNIYTEPPSLDDCPNTVVTKTIKYSVNKSSDNSNTSDSRKIAKDKSVNADVDSLNAHSKQTLRPDGLPKRKVYVKREAPVKPALKEYNIQENQGVFDSEPEHVFTRPEFHSTLRMTSEIKQLKESVIDVEKAVKQKLQLTDRVELELNEKASLKTNTDTATFSELISLDVPVEDLCHQVERKQSAKVKTTKFTKTKESGIDRKQPDLMEFFSRDLQKEVADFSQTGIPAPTEDLCTASHELALDLYRHNQVWEDF